MALHNSSGPTERWVSELPTELYSGEDSKKDSDTIPTATFTPIKSRKQLTR